MADETKTEAPRATRKGTSQPGDFGAAQVQDAFDEYQEQGYQGTKVDPLPNSAHSLESGPNAPTVAEQRAALAGQEAKANG